MTKISQTPPSVDRSKYSRLKEEDSQDGKSVKVVPSQKNFWPHKILLRMFKSIINYVISNASNEQNSVKDVKDVKDTKDVRPNYHLGDAGTAHKVNLGEIDHTKTPEEKAHYEITHQSVGNSPYVYNAKNHSRAIVLLGLSGSGKSYLMNSISRKHSTDKKNVEQERESQIEQNSSKLECSPVPSHAGGHKIGKNKYVELMHPDFANTIWQPTVETCDHPTKISKAKLCVLCMKATNSRFTPRSDNENVFLFSVRHLPKDSQGKPDLSKLKIIMTFGNLQLLIMQGQALSDIEIIKNIKKNWLNVFNGVLEKEYGKGLQLKEENLECPYMDPKNPAEELTL